MSSWIPVKATNCFLRLLVPPSSYSFLALCKIVVDTSGKSCWRPWGDAEEVASSECCIAVTRLLPEAEAGQCEVVSTIYKVLCALRGHVLSTGAERKVFTLERSHEDWEVAWGSSSKEKVETFSWSFCKRKALCAANHYYLIWERRMCSLFGTLTKKYPSLPSETGISKRKPTSEPQKNMRIHQRWKGISTLEKDEKIMDFPTSNGAKLVSLLKHEALQLLTSSFVLWKVLQLQPQVGRQTKMHRACSIGKA